MLNLPHTFGRYTLTRLLGEGGMAEVYQASVRVAEGLTKWVVIKKIKREFADQHEFTRMFVEEAKIALGLNHANIVQVFDFGQIRGDFYLAMELIEGLDLMRLFHAVRARQDAMPAVIAAYAAHQAASGLSYAHRKKDDYGEALGIVHRDVTPHNIMVSFDGQVKVLDFGIARTQGSPKEGEERLGEFEVEETIKGKIAYMSPEQASGRRTDARADVYSLGIVLYELLTGQLLYRGRDRMAQLERVRTESLPPILERAPELPDELAQIVDKALRRDPDERFESAREMQVALAHFLHRSDPVVDDDALAQFLATYRQSEVDISDPQTGSFSHNATREIGDSRSAVPLDAGESAQRVVLLQIALEFEGDARPSDDPLWVKIRELVRDLAFKREAHVVKLEAQGVLLAFGTLWSAGDDPERALRVARALREGIGEIAPSVGVGTVLMATHVTVLRSPTRSSISLPEGLAPHLSSMARRALNAEILCAGQLSERLARMWRFSPGSLPSPAVPPRYAGSPWAAAVGTVAELMGPLSERERRRNALGKTLFGRELELKNLRDGFAETIRSRESRSLLLIAEPGLGKRSLIERFIASLPASNCSVLRASGTWSARNRPLGVFLDLLSKFLRIDGSSTKRDVVAKLREYEIDESARLAEALCSALDLEGQEEANLAPAEHRARLARLVRRLLRALAARRPVLVVLENLHFIDPQSVQILERFVEQRTALPIFGITTSRPGPRAESMREEMVKDGRLEHLSVLELGELGPQARRDLITRRFEDDEEVEPLADAILARTGGNPLFIEEVLTSLLESGVIGWNAQARYLVVRQRGGEIELPPTIEDALRSRIESLSPDHREALQAAAVLGLKFRVKELQRVLDRDRMALDRTLDAFVDGNLLSREDASDEPDEMHFRTISLHEVCRATVLAGNLSRLNGLAADIKLHRDDYTPGRDDGIIAEHLIAAGDMEGAVDPAMRAARAAIELGGNREGYHHLTQALQATTSDDPRRFDALSMREPILRAWGQRRAQGADIRSMMALTDEPGRAPERIRATVSLLRFYIECGRMRRAAKLVPSLEALIRRSPNPEVHLAVLGELRSEIAFAKGQFDEAEGYARDALEHASLEPEGQAQRFRLLRCLGTVLLHTGHHSEARESFEQALLLAREGEHRRLEAEALTALGEVAGLQTRYQAAVDHFRAALSIDRDLGDRFATGVKLANLGITYTAIGLYRRAERYLRKALELHEAIGHPALLNNVMVNLGEVSFALGDPDSARDLLEEAANVAARRDDVRTELRARAQLMLVLLHDAGDERAAALAERAAKGIVETGRREGLRSAITRGLHGRSILAERRGDPAAAVAHEREACRLVQGGAARLDGPLCLHRLGTLLRAHPEQGEPGESALWLREAAEIVQSRLEALRDPELRHGYEEQEVVQRILEDGRS